MTNPLIVHAWMTLAEVLDALGYQTSPRVGSKQGKRVLRRGEVAFEGTADEAWKWLRQTRQIV